MRFFDHSTGDNSSVLQHIFQVDQIAVVHMLCEVVGVMKVDDSFLVRLDDVSREQQSFGQIFGDFAGHIIPLYRVDGRVFVGIFLLDFFIVALDQ